MDKLQDPNPTEVFKAKVGGKVAALNLDVETLTGNIKEVLLSSVIGSHMKKKQPWVTNDIIDPCNQRKYFSR